MSRVLAPIYSDVPSGFPAIWKPKATTDVGSVDVGKNKHIQFDATTVEEGGQSRLMDSRNSNRSDSRT